jgi:serine/threonine-protein kinase
MQMRERLKRTKLFQWGAAYLAGAWLVLQLTTLIGEQFSWPNALLRGITVLLGIGFFVALIAAWYHGETGRQRVSGFEVVLLAGVLVLAAVAVKLVTPESDAGPANQTTAVPAVPSLPRGPAIAVLPFKNLSADPSNEYFSDGITEELINALSRVEGLSVVARTSAASFKGKDIDVREIGGKLGATALLEGSVRKSGRQLRIQARLVNAADGYQLWSQVYDRELADVFAIQQEIATAIVEKLEPDLATVDRTSRASPSTSDLEAWDLYIQGRYLWNRRAPGYATEAIRYFSAAIARDSSFAFAYAGLADAYLALVIWAGARPSVVMPLAHAAVQRALALDPRSAPAHTSLAYIKYWYDWDWEQAEAEFQRAITLDRSYSTAHHWYSLLLITLGRTEEAEREIQLAQRLEPMSPIINTIVGTRMFYSREYEPAIAQGRHTADGDPTFAINRFQLGRAYAMMGRHAEAIAEHQRAVELSQRNPIALAALAHAYAVSGERARASALADSLERRARHEPVSPYWIGTLYAALGDTDRALDWLERAYDERDGWLVNLGVEPYLDGLREQRRFRALLSRLRLN